MTIDDAKRDTILCLCDLTGVMAEPWVKAGYRAILVDPQHGEGVHVDGNVIRVGHIIDHPVTASVITENLYRVAFVASFPPCTDLAVSGARWFKEKAKADPDFQKKAMDVVMQCRDIAELAGVPYFIENPVSRISSLWRKPDYSFHPYHFTAFDQQDNYTKKTMLWTGGGFKMPDKAQDAAVTEAIMTVVNHFGRMVPADVARGWAKANDRDLFATVDTFYPDNRIHQCAPSDERANIRSATPRGFAYAVFEANRTDLQ